jgi:hypothetical protein
VASSLIRTLWQEHLRGGPESFADEGEANTLWADLVTAEMLFGGVDEQEAEHRMRLAHPQLYATVRAAEVVARWR